jgi:hypothetical protein
MGKGNLSGFFNKVFSPKYSGRILAYSLALLSLFYTINSDILSQHDNSLLMPINSLTKINEEKINLLLNNIGDDKEDQTNITYLFVLDISGSLTSPKNVTSAPYWYEQTLKSVNDKLASPDLRFSKHRAPDLFYLSKLKLAELLLEFINNQKTDDTNINKFTIWTIGNEGINLFPGHEKACDFTEINIKKAIAEFKDIKNNDKDTNFFSLFDRLRQNYYFDPLRTSTQYKSPSYFWVIFSDLVHDIKNKLKKENNDDDNKMLLERNKDRRELEKLISGFAKTDIIANTIIVSDSKYKQNLDKYEYNIWNLIDMYFEDYRINKYPISEIRNDVLFTKIKGKGCLKFYYTNQAFLESSEFIICLNRKGRYKIGLELMDSSVNQNVEFKYNITDSNLKEKETTGCQGKISTKTPAIDLPELERDDKIKLSYSGHLPAPLHIINFEIYLPLMERKLFVIPIQFIKVLHPFVAYLMIMFWILLFYSLGGFICKGANHFYSPKQVRK